MLYVDRFTGNMKLKGLVLFGGEGGQHPNELRLYGMDTITVSSSYTIIITLSFKNRPPLGFDQLGGEPDQVIPVTRDNSASIDYPLKFVCIINCTNFSCYFFSRTLHKELPVSMESAILPFTFLVTMVTKLQWYII